MSTNDPRSARASHDGFTLLEMVAVVAILALVMSLIAPSFGLTRQGALREAAAAVASSLEYARQRAVMTARPHRLRLGLEEGTYQLEWFVTDADEDPDAPPPPPLDLRGPIPMSPPTRDLPSYRPVPGDFGDARRLDEDVYFEGVQMDEGWFDTGEFQIVFAADGSTAPAQVVLGSEGIQGYVLDVSPLLDSVRILDDEPR